MADITALLSKTSAMYEFKKKNLAEFVNIVDSYGFKSVEWGQINPILKTIGKVATDKDEVISKFKKGKSMLLVAWINDDACVSCSINPDNPTFVMNVFCKDEVNGEKKNVKYLTEETDKFISGLIDELCIGAVSI